MRTGRSGSKRLIGEISLGWTRPENQFTLDLTTDVRLQLKIPSRRVIVDSKSGAVPALTVGSLISNEPVSVPISLTLSVNGIFRSVTRSYQAKGPKAEFSVMVPETSFRHGENILRVFVLSFDGSGNRVLQLAE